MTSTLSIYACIFHQIPATPFFYFLNSSALLTGYFSVAVLRTSRLRLGHFGWSRINWSNKADLCKHLQELWTQSSSSTPLAFTVSSIRLMRWVKDYFTNQWRTFLFSFFTFCPTFHTINFQCLCCELIFCTS